MLFYRVLLFSYLIESLITLLPKIILAVGYLFFSSVILIALLTTSITATKYALLNPGASLHYLLSYLKWLWWNKKHISLGYFLYTLIAFIAPYMAWGYIKKLLKEGMKKIKNNGKEYLKSFVRTLGRRVKTRWINICKAQSEKYQRMEHSESEQEEQTPYGEEVHPEIEKETFNTESREKENYEPKLAKTTSKGEARQKKKDKPTQDREL